MPSRIKKLWNGDYPLHVSFWLVGTAAVLSIPAGITIALLNGSSLFEREAHFQVPLFSGLMLLFWLVCTWRSSAKYTGPAVWKYLARVCALLTIAGAAWYFFLSFIIYLIP